MATREITEVERMAAGERELTRKLSRLSRVDAGEGREQVSAPMTIPMTAADFEPLEGTAVYWLGSGGIFINCRGTLLMVDPVTECDPKDPEKSEAGFPFLVPAPITGAQVPKLDAVLYTHADYDHMAPGSARALMHTGAFYYGTDRSCRTLASFGIPQEKLVTVGLADTFTLGPIRISLTPCSHAWQKDRPEFDWYYGPEDCCGFYLDTPDGNLWIPGDSIPLRSHLTMKNVDAMFIDVSTDPFHFGPEATIQMANTYENARLFLYHYGTYLAPHKPAFSGDPQVLKGRLVNPERLEILAPGECFTFCMI